MSGTVRAGCHNAPRTAATTAVEGTRVADPPTFRAGATNVGASAESSRTGQPRHRVQLTPGHPTARIRSMTAMLPSASTGGNGTGEPPRTAVENASACTPYGSAVGTSMISHVRRDRWVAARRQDDARRTVGRDVERDLHQQPTGRADEVDALIVLDLRRARERRLAASEVEDGRREDVGAERRITQHGGDHTVRFAVEHPAGHVDRVAADVHQAPPPKWAMLRMLSGSVLR